MGLIGGVPGLRIWCEPQLCSRSSCHPKIFCDLARWQFFLNVIFSLQKRETSKCRLSTPALLDRHRQLDHTISHCGDKCPTVINRRRARTWSAPEEGQVLWGGCQLLFPSRALFKDQYYFMSQRLNLKKQQLWKRRVTYLQDFTPNASSLSTVNLGCFPCLFSNDRVLQSHAAQLKW